LLEFAIICQKRKTVTTCGRSWRMGWLKWRNALMRVLRRSVELAAEIRGSRDSSINQLYGFAQL